MNYKVDCKTPEVFRVVVDLLKSKGYASTWTENSIVWERGRFLLIYDKSHVWFEKSHCFGYENDIGKSIPDYFSKDPAKQLTIVQAMNLPSIMPETVVEQFPEYPEQLRLDQQERLLLDVTEHMCKIMKENSVTRSQLAKMLGKSEGLISQILDGERSLTLRTIANVFTALGRRVVIQTGVIKD